jgi:hypothetical protein
MAGVASAPPEPLLARVRQTCETLVTALACIDARLVATNTARLRAAAQELLANVPEVDS